jgi:hypothetical protein
VEGTVLWERDCSGEGADLRKVKCSGEGTVLREEGGRSGLRWRSEVRPWLLLAPWFAAWFASTLEDKLHRPPPAGHKLSCP